MQRMDQFDNKAERIVSLPMDVLSDGAAYLHGRRSNGFNDPPLLSSSLVSKADVALEEKGSETIG